MKTPEEGMGKMARLRALAGNAATPDITEQFEPGPAAAALAGESAHRWRALIAVMDLSALLKVRKLGATVTISRRDP